MSPEIAREQDRRSQCSIAPLGEMGSRGDREAAQAAGRLADKRLLLRVTQLFNGFC